MLIFVCSAKLIHAQRYTSRTVLIGFESVTPLETIKAENKNGVLILDVNSGRVEAAVLIKGFLFRKALMQQHFNDSYMESDKFPKAQFSGNFDPAKVSIQNSGKQVVELKGTITIHGVTKPHHCQIQLEFKEGNCLGFASFLLKPEDFSIQVPALVRDNINKKLKVELNTGWMKPNNH
jgi:hypothetical protein